MNDKNSCCGCGACASVCPVNAISMEYDAEGFKYPVLNKTACVNCKLCQKVCPSLKDLNIDLNPVVYGVKAKSQTTLLSSSSGGVFFTIAKIFMRKGAVVYGAAFDEDLRVKHIRVAEPDKLRLLQKSKYVQSNIEDCFGSVEKDLKEKRTVLFSGTPCQIVAIKSFLQREYDTLFCIDLICHGVPSPRWWDEYLGQINNSKKIKDIQFRAKNSDGGWEKYTNRVVYVDETIEERKYDQFVYGKAFLSNMSLRASCYECHYTSLSSGSDITLADYWNIAKLHPEFYDKRGVSIYIAHNHRAQEIFDEIRNDVEYMESSIYEVERNSGLFLSEKKPQYRDEFMASDRSLESLNFYLSKPKLAKKIGLFGSYNSRVAIKETSNTLEWQFCYSSIISVMSEVSEPFNISDDNAYRKEMREKDANKEFKKRFAALSEDIDFLVIDLLEERLHVDMFDNNIITSANDLSIETINKTDFESLFEVWKDAADRYIEWLLSIVDLRKIIFVKMNLSRGFGLHGVYQEWENIKTVDEVARYLRRCNDYFISKSGVNNIVSVNEKYNYCQKYHQYGKFPYHLNYEAYQDLGRQINKIIEREEND